MAVVEFCEKKIIIPIKNQLTQGADAKGLAKSAAAGSVMSIIPVFSVSTWLCVAIAAKWKLNQVVIQVFNYIFYPAQFALIPVYMAIGAKLTGSPPLNFHVKELIEQIKANPREVISIYGVAWIKGVVVWAITAPVIFIIIFQIMYFIFRHILKNKKVVVTEEISINKTVVKSEI